MKTKMDNMKNKILKYNIPLHTNAWYDFRGTGIKSYHKLGFIYNGGIGASESGTILYLSPKYEVALKLFLKKVGLEPSKDNFDNEAMFNGRIEEDRIVKSWRCYNPVTKQYMDTYKKYLKWNEMAEEYLCLGGNKSWKQFTEEKEMLSSFAFLRNGYTPKEFWVNSNMEWLFASLDFWCDEGFPVECKTISTDRIRSLGTYTDEYEICGIKFKSKNTGQLRIPKSYECQIQHQMLVSDSYKAEVPILIGGTKFIVNEYERNDEFCSYLLLETKKFWDNVLTARRFFNMLKVYQKENNLDKVQELEYEIYQLAPGGGNEESYKEYASKNYESTKETMEGDDEMLELLKTYSGLNQLIKEIEEGKGGLRNIRNEFISICKELKVDTLTFENKGKVDYKLWRKDSKVYDAYITPFADIELPEDVVINLFNKIKEIINKLK